uniref:Uncharacterized protein n=1 Tax=Magallana gigas TaxID=29159 RepID=K1PFD1_MAGGI
MGSTCGIIYASEHGTESLEFSPNQLCTNDYGIQKATPSFQLPPLPLHVGYSIWMMIERRAGAFFRPSEVDTQCCKTFRIDRRLVIG